MTNKEIGQKIRMYRIRNNIPMKAIAIDMGIDVSRLGAWERGEHKMSLPMFCKFCEVTGGHPNDILGL